MIIKKKKEIGNTESYYGDIDISDKRDIGQKVDEEMRFQGQNIDGGLIV